MNLISAQNFSVVTQGREYFYTDNFNTLAVRADSTSVMGNDTTYHHFSMFRDTANTFNTYICIDVSGGSLLGKKNIMTESGHFQIITARNETVTLLPNSQLNDSWNMFQLSNGQYIEATVTNISLEAVFDQTDLVKTITLNVKDQNNNPVVSNPFHLEQIKLSENFGLIQTFDFYLFPVDTTLYLLEGITNPKHGYVMSTRSVFDFEVGDVFHYSEKSINYSGWGSNATYFGHLKHIIKTVIGKTLSTPDTAVSYEFELCSRIITFNQSIPDTTYSIDTISKLIIFDNPEDSTFNQLPRQTFTNPNHFFIYNYPIVEQYKNNNQRLRVYYDRTDVTYDTSDSCWHWIMADPAPGKFYYFDGLGGPYYFIDSWTFAIPVKERKLLYYKKGSETWGTSIAPSCESLINNVSDNPRTQIRIYPNPTSDYITLDIENNTEATKIMILDISGRIVLQSEFKNEISLFSLPKGIYIVKVFNNQELMFIDKVIKL